MPQVLKTLLQARRVLVCAGSGGVGKTTIAAALALAGVSQGLRVLCLTIDPARRLANSLGLESMTTELHEVARERLLNLGFAEVGRLSVMMLDTKTVFDHLLDQHTKSPAVRQRIEKNKLYQYVSTHLAGVQSYMAMEKVLEVKKDSRFDLIVLDTPPTTEALDFLRAPERLVEALDSPAMRWLVQAFEPKRAFSFNLVARGAAFALRGLGRLTGKGFLESVAEFVTDMSVLFGGFRARASEIQQAFSSAEFGYVLVTAPKDSAIRDAEFFARKLAEERIVVDAVVVNRLHGMPEGSAPTEVVAARLKALGWRAASGLAEKVQAAGDQAKERACNEAKQVSRLLETMQALGLDSQVLVRIRAMPKDVHDLEALSDVARLLLA